MIFLKILFNYIILVKLPWKITLIGVPTRIQTHWGQYDFRIVRVRIALKRPPNRLKSRHSEMSKSRDTQVDYCCCTYRLKVCIIRVLCCCDELLLRLDGGGGGGDPATSGFVTYADNFRMLGKRAGGRMPKIYPGMDVRANAAVS